MNLLQFYGLDWLAMGLSVLAVYLLGNRKRIGFIAFVLANLLWIGVAVLLIKSYGIAMGNLIFLILNIRGYISWRTRIGSPGRMETSSQ